MASPFISKRKEGKEEKKGKRKRKGKKEERKGKENESSPEAKDVEGEERDQDRLGQLNQCLEESERTESLRKKFHMIQDEV